jgi:hypothetical protein
LGPEKVILGLPWLRHRNPAIDWQAGTMTSMQIRDWALKQLRWR